MSEHEDAITILTAMNGATRQAMHVTLGPGSEATCAGVGGFLVSSPGLQVQWSQQRIDDHTTLGDLEHEIAQRAAGRPTPPRLGLPVTAAFLGRLQQAQLNPIYDVRPADRRLAGELRGGGKNAPDAHTGVVSIYEPWKSYDNGSWNWPTDPKWLGRGQQP